MSKRTIKIESEVPCVFSETGAHKVTMLFTQEADGEDESDGLQLVHLSCECGEDAAKISEVLDAGTECCGLVRDDVRLAASGEDPRTHDPILANALKQIKVGNAKTHRMRAKRRRPVEHVMKLQDDANDLLPPGFEMLIDPRNAHVLLRTAAYSPEIIATYLGRGAWKKHAQFDYVVRDRGRRRRAAQDQARGGLVAPQDALGEVPSV